MDTEAKLARGQQAFEDGEHRAAIIDAKNILLDEPENVTARLLLGRASLEVGDGVSAEKELRRAVDLGAEFSVVLADLGRAMLVQRKYKEVIAEIDPELATTQADRLSAMLSRGEALIGLNRPEEARESFAGILAIDTSYINAQLGIVQAYVAEQNYVQARETLNQVLANDDSYIQSWLASGTLGMRARDFKRAASDYGRAAELARQSEDSAKEMFALGGLSDALMAQNAVDEVRVQLARMQEIGPEDTRTKLIAARLAAFDRDWPRAQELLQEILRRAPELRQAQMLLGYVHKEGGNLGQAEMYLSSVVAAVPGNADARRLLAETRLQMNQADDARKALEPLLADPDADVSSLSMAAGANMVLGEFDAATELMERVVAADPTDVEQQIQLALVYYQASNPAKAQEVLESIPGDLEGVSEFRRDSLIVLSKMAQGNSDAALSDAKALLQRWPDRIGAHTLVGAIQMSTGDRVAARSTFEAGNELEPGNLQSLLFLAQLDEFEGDTESAAGRYEQILEAKPDDVRSMVSMARLAARREDFAGTREWLVKASEAAPTSVAPRQLLGALLVVSREFDEAERVIGEALELQPDSPKLLALMGDAQLGQGDSRGAEFSYGRAMRLQPEEPAHRLNLSKAQATRGNRESAIVTLEDDMEQTMQNMQSAAYLAALKAETGDLDGALDISRRLRDAFPDESVPYALEGELQARSGNLADAAAAYEKALDIEATQRTAIRAFQIRNEAGVGNATEPLLKYLEERPFDSSMRLFLAQAHQQTDEVGKANTEYQRVLQDNPDNVIAANNLAWNYFVGGDPRAEEVARHAYSLQPNSGAVTDTLGWILVKKGNLDEGVALLRDAAEKSGGRPDIRYHLAAALVDAGEVAEAKSILEDVLSGDDAFSSREEAEELLASL